LTPFEMQDTLDSMVVLVDTREQPSKRAEQRYKSFGCPYRRQKLDFGDYSAEFILPDGQAVQLNAAVERKMSLDELAGCFTHDRKRFKAEFERGAAAGASMWLLVENATWENLLAEKYRSKFNCKAFLASITAWSVRYGLKLIFCKEQSSGRLIKEILFREMKERIERGEYG